MYEPDMLNFIELKNRLISVIGFILRVSIRYQYDLDKRIGTMSMLSLVYLV